MGSESRRYRPDFIVYIAGGHSLDDPLKLVIDIKGYRGEDDKIEKETMDVYWIPGANNAGKFGRWAFAEFCDVYEIQTDFEAKVESNFQ